MDPKFQALGVIPSSGSSNAGNTASVPSQFSSLGVMPTGSLQGPQGSTINPIAPSPLQNFVPGNIYATATGQQKAPNGDLGTSALSLTNALGLKGTTDTFGGDIAAATNPGNKYAPWPSLAQNAGAVAQTGAIAATPFIGPEALGVPGSIAAATGIGAANSGGAALASGKSASEAAGQAVTGGVVSGVTAGVATGLSGLLGAIGNKIMTSVIKPSAADIEDGFSMSTIRDNNLGGTLPQTLKKTQSMLNDLTAQLKIKLASSPTSIDLSDIYEKTEQDVASQSGKLKNFGANARVTSALAQLKGEVGALGDSSTVSIPEAQTVKQAAGNFGAWSYGKPDPDSQASQTVYNAFYRNLKTAIEENSPPGVKQINQQIGKLIPVVNAVIRRIPVAERNGAISLNEMISLTGAFFHPAAGIPALIDFASKSGPVGNALSRFAPVVGNAAPFVGTTASVIPSSNASKSNPVGQ